MPSLAVINRAENLRRSSRPGFGTRLFCRPLDQHIESSINGVPGIQLTGVNNIQAFNVATNPVRSSHMESPGGFIEVFRGLRDGGEIGFEANLFPDGMDWQRIDSNRDAANHTIFDDLFGDVNEDELYEMWVVPPRSTRYCWLARGFPSVGGPVMYEQEGIMRMMFSFKVSGQPLQLYPVGIWSVKGMTDPPAAITPHGRIDTSTPATVLATPDDFSFIAGELDNDTYYRMRLVVPRKWETWSKAAVSSETGVLAIAHPGDYSLTGSEEQGFHNAAGTPGGAARTADTDYLALLYREGGPFA